MKVFQLLSLALLVCSSNLGACSEQKDGLPQVSDYQKVRVQLKEWLYRSQNGILDRDAYDTLIERHLQEAEKKLVIPHYLKNKEALNLDDKQYAVNLVAFNKACFCQYIDPDMPSAQKLECVRVRWNFGQTISYIKDANPALKELDIESELDNTHTIMTQANKEYYKMLPATSKLFICLIPYLR